MNSLCSPAVHVSPLELLGSPPVSFFPPEIKAACSIARSAEVATTRRFSSGGCTSHASHWVFMYACALGMCVRVRVRVRAQWSHLAAISGRVEVLLTVRSSWLTGVAKRRRSWSEPEVRRSEGPRPSELCSCLLKRLMFHCTFYKKNAWSALK